MDENKEEQEPNINDAESEGQTEKTTEGEDALSQQQDGGNIFVLEMKAEIILKDKTNSLR